MGFTLIETLIYIALFGIILSGVIVTSYQMMASADRQESKIIVLEEGNFVLQKLDWLFTATHGVQDLVFQNDAITLNGLALTSSNVTVSNFAIQDLPANGKQPEGVKVDFTLKHQDFAQSFSITKYLRN